MEAALLGEDVLPSAVLVALGPQRRPVPFSVTQSRATLVAKWRRLVGPHRAADDGVLISPAESLSPCSLSLHALDRLTVGRLVARCPAGGRRLPLAQAIAVGALCRGREDELVPRQEGAAG